MRAATIWTMVVPLSLAFPAAAEEPLRLTYRTYAVGMHIADAEGWIGLGPWSYQLALSFRTIGVASVLFGGHSVSTVYGTWNDDRPIPRQFSAKGAWRGEPRATLIDYDKGMPAIRQLLPPLEPEREIVADNLRTNSTDSLSALAALIRTVARLGQCDSMIRTFDGRRATEIVARTAGPETLESTNRSSYSGRALRCDFVSRMLGGFRLDETDKSDFRPLHGSAWLAVAVPNHPAIPVRMTIETRWFGDATSYLTGIGGSDRQ